MAGAKQAGLPEEYIDGLKRIGSIPDPKPNRRTRLEALKALVDAGIK
jgi:hypothetical protein